MDTYKVLSDQDIKKQLEEAFHKEEVPKTVIQYAQPNRAMRREIERQERREARRILRSEKRRR